MSVVARLPRYRPACPSLKTLAGSFVTISKAELSIDLTEKQEVRLCFICDGEGGPYGKDHVGRTICCVDNILAQRRRHGVMGAVRMYRNKNVRHHTPFPRGFGSPLHSFAEFVVDGLHGVARRWA